ncbi:MAG TPA: chromosome segregation protein SMC [Firmicutes bacterium]|nr:chromosome segregation protein SMC [Candidatus Fermentithermobacillaceae bacterium]
MLKKLTLHGFKSFCDRTEITLGKGATAIVGPNGCGKSNLADALRWVLGEQNPRVLRSSKQQDFIFSGTETRKAMGSCEVRLLFDGITEDTETEIVRRLNRDGTGEYRLNGKACRWKDIVETLAGTGLSHTGYVVIGQGTIHELASGRPEDRRLWIEEASGVARVRLDKRDMESRLTHAAAELQRLDDLTVELVSRKEKLAVDCEATSKYRELTSEKREVELAMWLSQAEEEGRKVSALTKRLERLKSDREHMELSGPRLKEREASLLEKKPALDEAISEVQKLREESAAALLALEKERDGARGQAMALMREIENRSARREALKKDLDKLAAEEASLVSRREVLAQRLQEAAQKLEEAEAERAKHEDLRREYSERAISLRTEVVQLTGDLAKLQRSGDELRRKLDENRRRARELASFLTSSKARAESEAALVTELEARLKEQSAKRSEHERRIAELDSGIASARAALDKELAAEKNLGARLSAVRARKKVLEDLEKAFEGYGKGPRSVLEAASQGRLKGVVGSVSQLVSCEAKYISALSAAIGGAAENIVVEDEEAAKAAIAMLKKTNGGRATFLPISLMRPREMPPRAQEALSRMKRVRPLLSVLAYPENVEAAVRYLCGRIVLADDLDTALAFMRASGWTTRAVTLSGESIEPGGAMTGGEAPRSEALFRRKQDLLDLTSEETRLAGEMDRVLGRRKAVEKEVSSLSGERERCVSLLGKVAAQVSRLEEQLKRAQASLSSLRAEIERREPEKASLEAEEREVLAELGAISERLSQVSRVMETKQSELEKLDAHLKEVSLSDRKSSDEIQRLRAEKEVLERDLSSVLRRLDGIVGEKSSHEKSLVEEENEIKKQSRSLDEMKSLTESLGERISDLEEESRRLARLFEEKSAEREALLAAISECQAEIARIERDSETLLTRIEETAAEIEVQQRALLDTKELIASEFGVQDLSAVTFERLTRAQALGKLEELDEALRALGSVNLKAEEELKELSDRLEIIAAERADVEEAIKEIHRAREVVEKEIERRFLETFALVRDSFREIFRELFGGGSGDLHLIEETLGVEVTAEPPGRRQKHLNLLSGGERSLCGIALIFAILSVKPSPLIVLDEVDTALDEVNVVRFGEFLRRYSQNTQFLVITHQKATMEAADLLYGVTMQEPGVSKVFGMRLNDGNTRQGEFNESF